MTNKWTNRLLGLLGKEINHLHLANVSDIEKSLQKIPIEVSLYLLHKERKKKKKTKKNKKKKKKTKKTKKKKKKNEKNRKNKQKDYRAIDLSPHFPEVQGELKFYMKDVRSDEEN